MILLIENFARNDGAKNCCHAVLDTASPERYRIGVRYDRRQACHAKLDLAPPNSILSLRENTKYFRGNPKRDTASSAV